MTADLIHHPRFAETVLEQLGCGVIWIDRNLMIRWTNGWISEFTGLLRTELMGQPLGRLLNPEDVQPALRAELRAEPVRIVDHLGRSRNVLVQCSPSLDLGGWTLRIEAMEPVHSEREVAFQRMITRFANRSSDAFWSITMSETKIDEVHFVSAAWESMWGIQADELYAKPSIWQTLLSRETAERLVSALVRALQTGVPDRVEYRITRTDGQVRWLQSDFFPLNQNGTNFGVIDGTSRDITLRKKREVREKEERTLLATGELARGFAHDVNNLLVSVLANIDALEEQVPAVEQMVWQDLRAATESIVQWTDSVLEFAGESREASELVDIPAHLDRTQPLLRVASRTVGVNLRKLSPASVMIPPVLLTRALVNLVQNAADAESRAPIELRNATVHGQRAADGFEIVAGFVEQKLYTAIDVHDRGDGMCPESIRRAADPFYTTKDDGRGMGMAMVAGLCRSAGGALLIMSERGSGTTIRLLLPLAG